MKMYKRIKNRFLRWFLIVATFVMGLLVAYWLIIYLITPRYTFTEGRPFHGDYLYNPYQHMDPDHWKQLKIHC